MSAQGPSLFSVVTIQSRQFIHQLKGLFCSNCAGISTDTSRIRVVIPIVRNKKNPVIAITSSALKEWVSESK